MEALPINNGNSNNNNNGSVNSSDDKHKDSKNTSDRCNEFKNLALENIYVKFVADKLAEQCSPKTKIEDFIQW